MRRPPAVLALLALGSGCLPSRDNPRDPANSPNAVLKVVDETGDVVGPVSRGRNITLDASASSDPQNEFSCEFYRAAPTGDVPLEGCDGCRCELGDLRRQLPVDVPHDFHVAVRDASGGVDRSDPVTVRLTNSAPTVFAGPPRTLPVGGFPWALGVPFSVPFEAIASDPDGDRLIIQWSFPDEAVVLNSADPNDPAFTRTFPVAELQYAASVTVQEDVDLPLGSGRLTSFPSTTRVVIGFPNLWTAPVDTGEIERVDGGSGSLIPTNVEPGTDVTAALYTPIGPDNDRLLYYYVQGGGSGRLVSAPENDLTNVSTAISPGGSRAALAVDGSRGLLWANLDGTNLGICNGGPALASFDAATLATLSCHPLDATFDPELEVDDDGRVYTWEGFGSRIAFLDSAAGATLDTDVRESATNDLILGAGLRPAGNDAPPELWALVMPGLFDNEIQPTRLEVIRGGTVVGCLKIDAALATDIAFVARDELWIEVPEEGLFRLDASAIDARLFPNRRGGPLLPAGDTCPAINILAEASIQHVPGILDVVELLADRVTGDAWAASRGTGGVYRVQRDGDARLFDVASPPGEPHAIDPTGRLVFTTPGALQRGHGASADGVVRSIAFFQGGFPEPDLTTGGFWAALLLPPAIARVAEDGSIDRFETSVSLQTPGGPTLASPGLTRLFRVAPGTQTAYAMSALLPDFRPGSLFRVDLSTSPPTSSLVLDSAGSIAVAQGGSVWEPSSPATAGAPFVWTVMNGEVLALATDGQPASGNTPFVLPAPERSEAIRAAMSPRTNRLCIATINGTNLVLRRIAPNGTATLLDTSGLAFPVGSELVAVAAVPDAVGADTCFVAYNLAAGPRVIAWQDPGPGAEMQWQPPAIDDPPERSMSGYRITSIAPQARDNIWVTVLPPGESAPEKVHLVLAGNVLTEDRFLSAAGANVFVYPSMRAAPFEPPAP